MNPLNQIEAKIRVTGRVQGVGFRPFIYRIAIKNGLKGYVINLGDAGIEILVEGSQISIENFINNIRSSAPEVSEISGINVCYGSFRNKFKNFIIDKSKNGGQVTSGIYPPDIGICPDCLKDMEKPGSRWFNYPFTACAWCGPRFTAVYNLPYDRERTHMRDFPVCTYCDSDYNNHYDRRFDAQGITCKNCGPKMSLHDSNGNLVEKDNLFEEIASLLSDGKIVAIKGIGGFHLACLATEDKPIIKLRSRKKRLQQPFALMSPSLTEIKKFASLDKFEVKELVSWHRPIILLRKKNEIISDLVAPGLNRVGVMLPYSGIHVQLFKALKEPALIMTSGNRSGLPMSITNQSAFRELNKIADYYLAHNREVVHRCDDSLLRMNNGRRTFIRRSRGYVPDVINIPIKNNRLILSVGAEQSNSAGITIGDKCFLTQYLGDINNLESLEYEENAILKMRDLLNITHDYDVISCDLHPGYMTSQLAEVISHNSDAKLIKTQHHHAHIISACVENNVKHDEQVIGIALDGAGYGQNNAIWGGEILISTYSSYIRAGHLEELPMPGGDLCASYPYRMLISSLTTILSDSEIRDITQNHIENKLPNGETELEIILKQSRDINVLKTSSSGRFLDSISALLGICYERTYEGEPAMKLEAIASKYKKHIKIKTEITQNKEKYVLKSSSMLKNLLNENFKGKNEEKAAFCQEYLAKGVSEMALNISADFNINKILISGGACANNYISNRIIKILRDNDKIVKFNNSVPCGDGGIALGQSAIASINVI